MERLHNDVFVYGYGTTKAFDAIVTKVLLGQPKAFVDGPGSIGRTFLYHALLVELDQKILLLSLQQLLESQHHYSQEDELHVQCSQFHYR